MKVLVFGHSGIGYRVSEALYEKFLKAIQAVDSSIDDTELKKVSVQVKEKGKPFLIDYIASGDDDIITTV